MPSDASVYHTLTPIAILSPQQYDQQRLDQQLAVEDRQAKLQSAQEQRAAQDVLRRYAGDPEGALTELQRVSPSAALSYQKVLSEQRKSALDALKVETDVQKARTERGLQLLSVAKATKSPGAYRAAIAQLAMDDEDRQAFPAELPDEATLDQLLQMGLSVKDQYDLHEQAIKHYANGDVQKGFALALQGAGTDPEAWQEAVQAGVQMGVPKALAQSFAQPTPENRTRAEQLTMTPNERIDNQHAAAQLEISRGNLDVARGNQQLSRQRLAQQATGAARAASDVSNLTPEAVDLAALNYRKTGVMPPLGMSDRGNRQAILNRAATLTADDIARIEAGGRDIAGNKADYKANSDALTKLTSQRAAIGAFEQTAQKNIDVFLETAGKVVDTGSPLANRVARTLSGAVLGSPNQAAYEAARQVAINEIAKITSNPTLSGTLSDSARHEIEAFNPANATLKQTVSVMRLLKRDMQNRTTALDQEIADIRGRIGGGASTEKKADPLGIR